MYVEKLIQDEYGPQIQACERLYEYAKGLTKSWPGKPYEGGADAIILVLLGRSLDTFKAVIRLASDGYGAQAAMLNRSLFEDMIDAHWVATDPEAAEQNYEDQFHHARMLLADAAKKHPERYGDVKVPQFDQEERARLNGRFGEWGSKSWTTIGLHKRVGLVEHHWTDETSRRNLWFFHDIVHRDNNLTLHVSSTSLNANVEVSDDGGVTFKVGPRLDRLGEVLRGAFWIFQNLIGLIHDRFGIEPDERTLAEVFTARDFVMLTDEQMRETGRNDPCPCDSGLKFKRCHGA